MIPAAVSEFQAELAAAHGESLYTQLNGAQNAGDLKMLPPGVAITEGHPYSNHRGSTPTETHPSIPYLYAEASAVAQSFPQHGLANPELHANMTPGDYYNREHFQYQHVLQQGMMPLDSAIPTSQGKFPHAAVFANRQYRNSLESIAERAKMRLQDNAHLRDEAVAVNPIINIQELTGYTGKELTIIYSQSRQTAGC